jgi:hypothetical protein
MADNTLPHHPGSLLDTLQYWDSQLSSTAAGYFTRLYAGFYTINIVASIWVYFVARKLQPGRWRALACLPVVVLQMAATPFLVDRTRTAVLIVPVCGMLSLAAFKVRAHALASLADCTQCHGGGSMPSLVTTLRASDIVRDNAALCDTVLLNSPARFGILAGSRCKQVC